MPRGIKGSGPTRTRTPARRRITATVAVELPGKLVWAGVPDGGVVFELYELPTGGLQFFQATNNGGTITRSLMYQQGAKATASSSVDGSTIKRRTRRVAAPHTNGASNGTTVKRRARRVTTPERNPVFIAES